MRRMARDLLDRLLADRDASEQRLAETGKRDPIRTVTGRTALEGAIISARNMIDHIDDVLAQMGHRDPATVPVVQFPSKRVLKPQIRLAGKLTGAALAAAIPVAAPVSAVAS